MRVLIRYPLLLTVFVSIAAASAASAQTVGRNTRPTVRYAAIITIRDYPDAAQLPSLDGSNRDAERLRDTLIRGGYSENNIRLIYDDAPDRSRQPSRSGIINGLKSIAAVARSSDELLVLSTSHGLVRNEKSYLCASDTTDSAVDGNAQDGLLAVDEITKLMSEAKAEKKLLIIDACRGTETNGFVESLSKPPQGVWVMSSTSKGEKAYESSFLSPGESHPIFSWFVREGLNGQADLLGNYDGKTSVAELHTFVSTKTRAAATEIGQRQTPELHGNTRAGLFTVATVPDYVPKRNVATSDPETERRYASDLAASSAIKKVNNAQQEQISEFVKTKNLRQSTNRIVAFHRSTHETMCYILGNYLTPALELDPQNKLAHLARGHIFRSCGLYAEAADEYHDAGEHFELFVLSDHKALGKWLDDPKNRAKDDSSASQAKPNLTGVRLRKLPSRMAESAGMVPAHSKVRISHVSHSETGDGSWLYVTAVDDVKLRDGGWISREDVVWFKEAADLYTPRTPMSPGRYGGAATAVTRMDNAANRMYALADRVDAPAIRLNNVANRIDNSRAGRALGIARRFGAPIPSISAPVRRAAGYAGLPGSYIRRGGSYTRMPANYARSYGARSGYVGAYRAGLERSTVTTEQQDNLLKAATLDPVEDRPILVSLSPWGGE